MSKRKLESNAGMHPSNPYYNNKPDFVALAELYPSLKPFLIFKTEKSRGSVSQATINFRDPVALRELTYCLLKRDFSIQLDIPLDSLCPPIPNRLNYVCWIEDLMKNDTKKDIYGIDIGTGASSIAFANKNISTNHLEQTITVMKITSSEIFQDALFQDGNNCYDFSMCNPPFYESEQDIQGSFMGKEDRPSAVCQGTSNEMITKGGEVQFVKQMVDESSSRRERIRWYTSMLGKRGSVDEITAYLREKKILNYTLTTFRQGQTNRWAIAWSYGEERPSWASMQHISSKMIKLAPPATILSFVNKELTIENAIGRIETILDQLLVDQVLEDNEAQDQREPAIFRCRVRRNTWSRAARRAIARQKLASKGSAKDATGNIERPSEPVILEFDLRVVPIFPKHPSPSSSGPTESTGVTALGLSIEQIWTSGLDRGLFESFFLHLKSEVNKGPLEDTP
ncbi:Methyltransferase-like protein 16 [Mortierella polycephala]|uniref:U6 small nuclear RNA (adenine-(43)-N(6))-methyltransferase n=1 Tax=Mortierella polycephala TaxID=41804 RepID=A0A9P6U274_9FUNG|nr:Methyltransferase-like protein 16 [Mortierella polycephala]